MEDPSPKKISGSGERSDLAWKAWVAWVTWAVVWVCKNYMNMCQKRLSLAGGMADAWSGSMTLKEDILWILDLDLVEYRQLIQNLQTV